MTHLVVEPLKAVEVDDFIRLQWKAFATPEAEILTPMIWTGELTPGLLERFRLNLLRQYEGRNIGDFCFRAIDSSTGETVAIAKWDVEEQPAVTKEDVDEEVECCRQKWRAYPPVGDRNAAMHEAVMSAMAYSEWRTMRAIAPGQPYLNLQTLATHPKHERKGAGGLLLRHGLDRLAAPKHLPVFLTAALRGKDLYKKHGFLEKDAVPFDARLYGGRSEGRHWCMVRPARP